MRVRKPFGSSGARRPKGSTNGFGLRAGVRLHCWPGCIPCQTGVPARRGTTATIQPDISAARPSPDERGIGFSIEQIWPDPFERLDRALTLRHLGA
jgi:hypothetical protein